MAPVASGYLVPCCSQAAIELAINNTISNDGNITLSAGTYDLTGLRLDAGRRPINITGLAGTQLNSNGGLIAAAINASFPITLTNIVFNRGSGVSGLVVQNATVTIVGSIFRNFFSFALQATQNASVTIRDTAFNDNVNTGGTGAAININGATLNLKTVCFIRSSANGNGGAVSFYSPTLGANNLTISDCLFSTNKATGSGHSGAALYLTNAIAVITNTVFLNNAADVTSAGGAITADSSWLTVTGSTFTNNVGYQGGAIFYSSINGNQLGAGSILSVSSCTFNNQTAVFGGALFFSAANAVFVLRDSNFTSSRSTNGAGGAVLLNQGAGVTITGSSFSQNMATGGTGGAVGLQSNNQYVGLPVLLQDLVFTSNTANSVVGGALGINRASISARNLTFCNNTLSTSGAGAGGAMSVMNSSMTATSMNFNSNQIVSPLLTHQGGGLYFKGTSLTLSGNFTRNSGATGGAIYFDGTTFNYLGGTISNNNATVTTGGIYIASGSSDVNITGAVITGHTANAGYGSAICNNGSGTLRICNSNFNGNSANVGGAVYTHGDLFVMGGSYTTNAATLYGGAYAVDPTSSAAVVTIAISSSTLTTNIATAGGAVAVPAPLSNSLATADVTLSQTSMQANAATASGGAVFVALNVTKFAIVLGTISGNNAVNGDGGAFLFNGTIGTLSIDSPYIGNNIAYRSGGVLFANVVSGILMLAGINAVTNYASTGVGGAFYIGRPGNVTLQTCTFTQNTALSGGGVFALGPFSALTIAGAVNFVSNTAVNGPGAHLNMGANSTLVVRSVANFVDGASSTTAAGGAAIHMDAGATVSITGATFRGNSGAIAGSLSGVLQIYGSLYIASSSFIGNTGGFLGGALLVEGSLTITGSTFARNQASNAGALTFKGQPSALSISFVTFDGNYARLGGNPAVALDVNGTSPYYLTNCIVVNHNATFGPIVGGVNAIAPVVVLNSVFSNNNVSIGTGGALNANIWALLNSTFTNNTCYQSGAAATLTSGVRPSVLMINGSTFSYNTGGYKVGFATSHGGALYIPGVPISVHNSTFVGNTSPQGAGGAIFGDVASVLDSVFSYNAALYAGGAIASTFGGPAIITVSGSTFTLNRNSITASPVGFPVDGGALWVMPGTVVVFSTSIFRGNTAALGQGGAVAADIASIGSCVFTDNSAYYVGGALASNATSSASLIPIVDSFFSKNTACNPFLPTGGGALYVASTNGISLTRTTFNSNVCTLGTGGGVFASVSSVTDSVLSANVAMAAGGGINNRSPGLLVIRGMSFSQNSATSISGNGGAVSTTGPISFDGGNQTANFASAGGAIVCASSNFSNTVVSNNIATVGYGGAIEIMGSGFTQLVNISFTKNYAQLGGAVHGNQTLISVINCVFTANTAATFQGGAIAGMVSGVFNSTFIGNTAQLMGAAINGPPQSYSGVVPIVDSKFESNTACLQPAAQGGGALNIAASVTILRSNFTGNNCTIGGGAVYFASLVSIVDSNFAGNRVGPSTNGGAVLNLGTTMVTINGSTFTSNIGTNNGGAFYSQSPVIVANSTFSFNSAKSGGAIYSRAITVLGSTFTSNNASTNGGAIVSTGQGCARIENSTLSSNTACSAGGGLYVRLNLVVKGSTFSSNQACLFDPSCGGGAIYQWSTPSSVDITNSSFAHNRVTNGGAAVFMLKSSALSLIRVSFVDNVATVNGGSGGALVAPLNGTAFISDCYFADNNAGSAGAAFLEQNSIIPTPITIQRTAFVHNEAYYEGAGALILSGFDSASAITLVNNSFTHNFALDSGGALSLTDVYTVVETGGTYVHNFAGGGGGAIFDTGSTLVSAPTRAFIATQFIDNSACGVGGAYALEARGSTTVGFVACVVECNTASDGGFLSSKSTSTVSVTNATVVHNLAVSGDGGAIDAVGNVNILSSSFLNNGVSATGAGGAIFAKGGSLADSTFANNYAGLNGGAISVVDSGSCLQVINCSFTNNTSDNFGGAISLGILSPHSLLNGSLFVDNHAVRGGAVFVDYISNDLVVAGSLFLDNIAGDLGGALYLSEANFDGPAYFGDYVNINGVRMKTNFTLNAATNMGAAVYAAGQLTVDGVVFLSNSADSGSAVTMLDSAVISGDTSFTNNQASTSGAAIVCSGCRVTFAGASPAAPITFIDNVASTFPVFTCTGGSHIDAMSNLFVGPNNDALASRDQLVADCAACGCCSAGAFASFPSVPCFPYPGRNCTPECPFGYAKSADVVMCGATQSFVPGPVCQALSCPPVSTVMPPGGSLAQGSSVVNVNTPTTGDYIVYGCPVSYDLVGNATNYCFGFWNSSTPLCLPRPCNDSSTLDHGRVINPTSYRVNDTIVLECDPGYLLPTNTHVTCGSTLVFEPPLASVICQPILCPPLDVPTAPLVVDIQSNYTGGTATYNCGLSSAVNGNATRMCNGTMWLGVAPVCVPLPCTNRLDPLANGTVVYTFFSNTTFPVTGDRARCLCNPGFALKDYRLPGSDERRCTAPNFDQTCECQETACPIFDTNYVNITGIVAVNESVTVQCAPGAAGARAGTSTCTQTGVNVVADFVLPLIICEQCPVNQWSAGNAINCQFCSNGGTTAGAGSTQISDCICVENFYETAPGVCEACPDGAFCAGGSEPPIAKQGFWKVQDTYLACTPAEACDGNNTCHEGYEGLYCGACSPHFYRLNGRCLACPNDIGWRLFGVVLVGLALAYGLVLIVRPSDISERSYGFASGTIALSFIQIVATFADLNVHWPIKTRQVFDLFSTLNLNLELAGPECFATFTFWQKFQLQMSIPLMAAGLLLILWFAWTLAVWLIRKRPPLSVVSRKSVEIAKISAGAYLFFLTLAYLLLAKATLAVFACKQRAGGAVTLASAPTESCLEQPWGDNAIIGGFGIALYIVGIPIFVHVVYVSVRRRFGAHVATRSLFSNFLVKRYREQMWFWEGVSMLRKLAVVIVTTLFDGDAFFQVALCSAVFFLSCVATLVYRPYRWSKHNTLEIISLVGSLIVLFCGQMSGSPQYGPKQQEGLGIIAIITVAICMALFGACFALETGIFCTISRLNKQLNVAGAVTKCPSATSQPVSVLVQGDRVLVSGVDGLVLGLTTKEMRLSLSMPMGHKTTATALYGPAHLAAAFENTVEVWDTSNRTCALMGPAPSTITCLDASSRGVVVGCAGGQLVLLLFNTPLLESVGVIDPRASLPQAPDTLTVDELELILDDEGENASRPSQQQRPVSMLDSMSDPRSKSSRRNMAKVLEDLVLVEAHEGGVAAVCVAGAFVYSVGTNDGLARKWSVKSGTLVREFTFAVAGAVQPTSLVENGEHLFIGDSKGTVHVIDLVTNAAVTRLRGHTSDVARMHVAMSTDGNGGSTLITGSLDGTVLLWDAEDLRYLQTLTKQAKPIVAVAASRDGSQIFWATQMGVLFTTTIQTQWHMRDFDPQLGTLACNKLKRRLKGVLALGDTNPDKQTAPYEELQLISRDLGVTRDGSNVDDFNNASTSASAAVTGGTDMWAQLDPESAAAVARALQAQALARDGKSV